MQVTTRKNIHVDWTCKQRAGWIILPVKINSPKNKKAGETGHNVYSAFSHSVFCSDGGLFADLEFDSEGLLKLMKKANNFFFEPNCQSGRKPMWWKCQPFCIYVTLNLNISKYPCDLRTFRLLCTALGMRKFQDIQIIFALSTNEKLLFCCCGVV